MKRVRLLIFVFLGIGLIGRSTANDANNSVETRRFQKLQDEVDKQASVSTLSPLLALLIESKDTARFRLYFPLLQQVGRDSKALLYYQGRLALLDNDLCLAYQALTQLRLYATNSNTAEAASAKGWMETLSSVIASETESIKGINEASLACLLQHSEQMIRTRGLHRSASIYLDIKFDTDSDSLTQDGHRAMARLLSALGTVSLNELRLNLVGHADERGTQTYNQALSERRAERVRQELERLSPRLIGHVTARGAGEGEPKLLDSTHQAWTQNRRVEIFFSRIEDAR